MAESVIEAIKTGIWDFEPSEVDPQRFDATDAIPGSHNKLDMLAERAEHGLPLWHPADRHDYEG